MKLDELRRRLQAPPPEPEPPRKLTSRERRAIDLQRLNLPEVVSGIADAMGVPYGLSGLADFVGTPEFFATMLSRLVELGWPEATTRVDVERDVWTRDVFLTVTCESGSCRFRSSFDVTTGEMTFKLGPPPPAR